MKKDKLSKLTILLQKISSGRVLVSTGKHHAIALGFHVGGYNIPEEKFDTDKSNGNFFIPAKYVYDEILNIQQTEE